MQSVTLDKWVLISPLGAGGMGEVWVARHTLLGHQGAIKLMHQEIAYDQREVGRFMQEGQIAAQLRHRNIVRVEDVGRTSDGRPYLVMELLEGESLERRLQHAGTFTPRMALALMRPACEALTYAHAAGVIHRDIKLANLFIALEHGEEVLKILDFGLARVSNNQSTDGRRLTAPRAVIGTPKYMAPEQVMGLADIDRRADLWSLAVVLYRMLTDHHPFPDTGTNSHVLMRVLEGKITPPSQYRPELSPAIDAWVARALALDRAQRFQSAAELLEHFARAVDHSDSTDERTVLTPHSVASLLRGPSTANLVTAVPVRTMPPDTQVSAIALGATSAAATQFAAPKDPSLPRSASPAVPATSADRPAPRVAEWLRRPQRMTARTAVAISIGWVLLVASLALVARTVRRHRAAPAATHEGR